MKWSYRIARISGIDVRVHVTFLLLLAWFGWAGWALGPLVMALNVAQILLLFLCVLLHEFGHAFAARRYGIPTPDITLLPIGGVARLARMPDDPMQEFVVAIAGPLVNVAIVAVLFLGLAVGQPIIQASAAGQIAGTLAADLLRINVMLILFNLIPAFPMDGGRVLRALLATRLGHVKATGIAARVGQGIAILFAIVGIFGVPGWFDANPFLLFIAMFVFAGAQQEAAYANMRAAAAGLRIADAMITRFHSFQQTTSLPEAIAEARVDQQPIYPVVDHHLRYCGMILRNRLLEAPASQSFESLLHPTPAVSAEATFDEALGLMQQSGDPVLPVLNPAGQLIGLISLNLITERARGVRAA